MGREGAKRDIRSFFKRLSRVAMPEMEKAPTGSDPGTYFLSKSVESQEKGVCLLTPVRAAG
jgi:hypothetical protein